jgi:riboflavin kinase/FMN adenylyltransferase
VRVTSSTHSILTPTAIALGNFDGIHLGHQKVFQPILFPSKSEVYPTVVTFDPHPRVFFTGQQQKLLTPLPEKTELLDCLGVQQLVMLPFDRELARLTPEAFVKNILIRQLHPQRISVGEDFRFGHQRRGDAQTLQAIASQFGVKVVIIPLYRDVLLQNRTEALRVSSSLIRKALNQGEIQHANQMLGRSYTLTGKVVKGAQLGRTLGFPTANLELPSAKFLPRYGVYGVKVELKDPLTQAFVIPGVMNIGCRPTVNGERVTVEVHLLDWQGDLYGTTLSVSLEDFIRPERKFASLEALKAQIEADCQKARKILLR